MVLDIEKRLRELEYRFSHFGFRLERAEDDLRGIADQVSLERSLFDAGGGCNLSTILTVNVLVNGSAFAGATVTVTGPGGFSASGTTNGSGQYSVDVMSGGTGLYTVSATATNMTTATTNVSMTCGVPASVTLTLTCAAAHVINLTVTGCNNCLLPGSSGGTPATVTTSWDSNTYTSNSATSGANVPNIALPSTPGTYQLFISCAPRFQSTIYTFTYNCTDINATVSLGPSPSYVSTTASVYPINQTLYVTNADCGLSGIVCNYDGAGNWNGCGMSPNCGRQPNNCVSGRGYPVPGFISIAFSGTQLTLLLSFPVAGGVANSPCASNCVHPGTTVDCTTASTEACGSWQNGGGSASVSGCWSFPIPVNETFQVQGCWSGDPGPGNSFNCSNQYTNFTVTE